MNPFRWWMTAAREASRKDDLTEFMLMTGGAVALAFLVLMWFSVIAIVAPFAAVGMLMISTGIVWFGFYIKKTDKDDQDDQDNG